MPYAKELVKLADKILKNKKAMWMGWLVMLILAIWVLVVTFT
jgi:hypothetical protein